MINVHMQFAIYGLAFILFLGLIASWIQKREIYETASISKLAFGFVIGGVGSMIVDGIRSEMFLINRTLGIVCICLLGLGILGTTIQIVFTKRGNEE